MGLFTEFYGNRGFPLKSHLAAANYPSLCVLSVLLAMSLCMPVYVERKGAVPTKRAVLVNPVLGRTNQKRPWQPEMTLRVIIDNKI